MSGRSMTAKLILAGLVTLSIVPLPSTHAAIASAPALIGTIKGANGTPAAGARVVAVVLDHAPATLTPATILAESRSGADGAVQLGFIPGIIARQAAAANGNVLNVMVAAFGVGDAGHAYFGTFATPLRLGFDGTLPSVSKSFTLTMQRVNVPPLPIGQQPQNQCGVVRTAEGTTSAYTTVAELHSWDDMTGHFTYNHGGSSQLDSGYSTDGSNWSVSGTVGITNQNALGDEDKELGKFGYQEAEQFEYQETEWHWAACSPYSNIIHHEVTADKYIGGGISGPGLTAYVGYNDGPDQYEANNSPNHMVSFSANHTEHKTSGVTQRYEAAASVFGFSVGVESQYSTNLGFDWAADSQLPGAEYHIWGDNSGTLDTAQNVYAYAGPDPAPLPPPPNSSRAGEFLGTFTVTAFPSTSGSSTSTATGQDCQGTYGRIQALSAETATTFHGPGSTIAISTRTAPHPVWCPDVAPTALVPGPYYVYYLNGPAYSGSPPHWVLDCTGGTYLGSTTIGAGGWVSGRTSFSLPAGSSNISGTESAVCISDDAGQSGNQAPILIK